MSAESGVPTFREAQTGLWARFDPQELVTPERFRRDPRLVWDWYAWRRELVNQAQPNPGHLALAELERRFPGFTLVTQNVDGLHHRAGSQTVLELHGNINRTRCFQENIVIDDWPDTGETPPPCPRCGGLLRPDVVWFGEALPRNILEAAMDAAVKCDLFFSIGTSALVQPAAFLPFEAQRYGAVTVEINPDETSFTPHATYALHGPAGQVLPALMRAAFGEP